VSEEHMELARRVFENRNWSEEMDEMELRSIFDPDVELLPQRAGTDGAYRGIASIEKFRADTEQVFEKFDLVRSICAARERGRLQLRRVGGSQNQFMLVGGPPAVQQLRRSGARPRWKSARHECFVMNAGVSVKTAESAELDEEAYEQRLGSRRLLHRKR
jgi:hypothetical protein